MKFSWSNPARPPKEKNISGTLDSMQEAVGGTIQAIYPFDEPVALICNDDGKTDESAHVPLYSRNRGYHLRQLLCRAAPPGHRNFTSLSKEQIERYKERFRFPETFLRIGGDAIFVLRNL